MLSVDVHATAPTTVAIPRIPVAVIAWIAIVITAVVARIAVTAIVRVVSRIRIVIRSIAVVVIATAIIRPVAAEVTIVAAPVAPWPRLGGRRRRQAAH